jgi:hypothetical protein
VVCGNVSRRSRRARFRIETWIFARAGTHVVVVIVVVIVIHRWFALQDALRHWHFALDERRHVVDLIAERNSAHAA